MAFDALPMAKAAGLDVIVVDHHKCAAELPRRLRLVNPNRLDENDEAAPTAISPPSASPSCWRPAIVRAAQRGFISEPAEPDLLALLDLVALGTVADVAAQHGPQPRFGGARPQSDGAARTSAWPR
jgi:single-stranded-DNA-specific exonuclease